MQQRGWSTKISAVSASGDLQQQHREAAQPDLELGLGLALAEPEGDPAELGRAPVATTTPRPLPACTTVPISAQEVRSASAAPAATGSADPCRPAATRR